MALMDERYRLSFLCDLCVFAREAIDSMLPRNSGIVFATPKAPAQGWEALQEGGNAMMASGMSGVSVAELYTSQYRNQRQSKAEPDILSALGARSSDKAEISPSSIFRNSSENPLNLFSSVSSSHYKTIDEVGADLAENYADFENLIGKFFRTADIDTSEEIVLSPDGKGHILERGGHSQENQINNGFSDNPVFTGRFMIIAARASIVDAAETLSGFSTDYQKDPPGAIREHIDGLKERLLGFQMRIKDGNFTHSFV